MMITSDFEERRTERRMASAVKVRFFVNDGPEHVSNAINFTSKSLAIRSSVSVKVGDKVRAMIEHLPVLGGTVKRVWKEGFAIVLTEEARALIDHSHCDEAIEGAGLDTSDQLKEGADPALELVEVKAPEPCWFGICRPPRKPGKPRLLVVTANAMDPDTIRSVWLSIAEMRSSVRILKKRLYNDRLVILVRIHDWQIAHARQHGLSVSVLSQSLDEWKAVATPEDIEEMLIAEKAPAANVAQYQQAAL